MKKIFILLFLIFLTSGLILPLTGQCFGIGDIDPFIRDTGQATGLQQTDFAEVTARIITTVLGITGAIFIILIIYSGVSWIMSQGNQEKVDKARKTLTYAIIGVVVVMAAYSIAYLVASTLENAPATLPLPSGGNSGGGFDDTCTGSNYFCTDEASCATGAGSCNQPGDICYIIDGKPGCTGTDVCCYKYSDPCIEFTTKDTCNSASKGCQWVIKASGFGFTCINAN